MQPWRYYLRAIIFYNSMDAVGTAKLAALYVLANNNDPRRVDPDEAPA